MNLDNKQSLFLKYLIECKQEMSNKEIQDRCNVLNLDFKALSYVVAVLDIELDDYLNKDDLILSIQNTINETINNDGYFGCSFYNSYNNFWILINHDVKLENNLLDLKKTIEKKYKLEAYIGIGRSVTEINKLRISAIEAQEVLQYKSFYQNNGIIYIDDVVHFVHRSREGSNYLFQKVISYFISGDIVQMKMQLNNLIEEIRYTPEVSNSSIRRLMVELTVTILNIASNMDVDVDKVLDGIDPYKWIISQNHTEIITDWFIKLCEKMTSEIKKKRQNNNFGIIDQACQYIENNISDSSLGLISVSDYVGLTPPYLSQLFKKEKKIGINTYIKNYRIKKASELIKNTQMKMEQIAQDVGFGSASYFNQVFKNETGLTPLELRKKKILNNLNKN